MPGVVATGLRDAISAAKAAPRSAAHALRSAVPVLGGDDELGEEHQQEGDVELAPFDYEPESREESADPEADRRRERPAAAPVSSAAAVAAVAEHHSPFDQLEGSVPPPLRLHPQQQQGAAAGGGLTPGGGGSGQGTPTAASFASKPKHLRRASMQDNSLVETVATEPGTMLVRVTSGIAASPNSRQLRRT